jgi:hypothetical protein
MFQFEVFHGIPIEDKKLSFGPAGRENQSNHRAQQRNCHQAAGPKEIDSSGKNHEDSTPGAVAAEKPEEADKEKNQDFKDHDVEWKVVELNELNWVVAKEKRTKRWAGPP